MHARPHQHQPGRLARHELPVAAGARDSPREDSAGRFRADPGRNQDHPVGGKDLHVDTDARAEGRPARSDHGTAHRRLEGRSPSDRSRLRQ